MPTPCRCSTLKHTRSSFPFHTKLPPPLPPQTQISALHWNQDEDAGGFGGAHCMVPGGYDAVFAALADALGDAVQLGTPVVEVGACTCVCVRLCP